MSQEITDAVQLRREIIAEAKQVIVKAGSRLLRSREAIATLIDGVAKLRQQNKKVLLVTSGAVGMGMKELNLTRRPRELAKVQALAAIGQSRLMELYGEECGRCGIIGSQLLLTADDLRDRGRYLNVANCISALWENGVLPIINENDAVSVDELKFGDNDTLAGLLASLTEASLTIILTTEAGFRNRNADGTLGDRLSVVPAVNEEILAMAGGTDDGELSIGGMASKLHAAEIITSAGKVLWITDGRDPNAFDAILNGEDVGTVFLPRAHRLTGRKRWITFFRRVSGSLLVDDGAKQAVTEKGKSLLPSGLRFVSGNFKRGDAVDIVGSDGKPFARGLVNFDAAECLKLCGISSEGLHAELGANVDDEIIHRDNLTLTQGE